MEENQKLPPTYEEEVLRVMAFEFSSADEEKSEKKIKRKLKDKKLGEYDQSRIDRLRKLKRQLQHEMSYPKKSIYFTPQGGKYSDIKDFNVPQMVADLAKQYPEVPKTVLASFVPYAVYLYYLR